MNQGSADKQPIHLRSKKPLEYAEEVIVLDSLRRHSEPETATQPLLPTPFDAVPRRNSSPVSKKQFVFPDVDLPPRLTTLDKLPSVLRETFSNEDEVVDPTKIYVAIAEVSVSKSSRALFEEKGHKRRKALMEQPSTKSLPPVPYVPVPTAEERKPLLSKMNRVLKINTAVPVKTETGFNIRSATSATFTPITASPPPVTALPRLPSAASSSHSSVLQTPLSESEGQLISILQFKTSAQRWSIGVLIYDPARQTLTCFTPSPGSSSKLATNAKLLYLYRFYKHNLLSLHDWTKMQKQLDLQLKWETDLADTKGVGVVYAEERVVNGLFEFQTQGDERYCFKCRNHDTALHWISALETGLRLLESHNHENNRTPVTVTYTPYISKLDQKIDPILVNLKKMMLQDDVSALSSPAPAVSTRSMATPMKAQPKTGHTLSSPLYRRSTVSSESRRQSKSSFKSRRDSTEEFGHIWGVRRVNPKKYAIELS